MKPIDAPVDLHALFDSQKSAAAREPFPSWEQRADRLRRMDALLREHEAELVRAIDTDFGGRPAFESELADFIGSYVSLRDALRHGRRWMKPRRAGVAMWFRPASARIVPQPLGVVGIIVPWNYPLFLAIGPLAGVLAAGNRAMIKLSEFTPTFSALFARRVAERFAPDEVAVVEGGPEVAAQFSALPFDHLVFTGSTTVGRKVMAAAAPNLTPVTLELGGKSPTVITPGYPLVHAAERIMFGKLLNAGQTCIAPDYVLVPQGELDAFVDTLRTVVQRHYPQGLQSEHLCSVVNMRQYARLAQLVDDAKARGLRTECLFTGAARDDARHRLGLHVVVDPAGISAAMADEIFGPVLPIVPYARLDDALAFITARPRPLALYWFDHDRARVDDMLLRTHAGGVTINDCLLHVAQESLPFGGVGPSGLGHYHGEFGFQTFSKLKPVFQQARFNGMKLFLPPVSGLALRMLGLMKRF